MSRSAAFRIATVSRTRIQDSSFLQSLTRPFDLKRPAALEVLLLTLLCAADMYSTVYWVKTGQAIEANPLLAWTFHVHPIVFVLLKTATFLPTLILAAYLARRYPLLVTILLRCVLVAYIGIYLVGVFHGS